MIRHIFHAKLKNVLKIFFILCFECNRIEDVVWCLKCAESIGIIFFFVNWKYLMLRLIQLCNRNGIQVKRIYIQDKIP